MARRCSASHKRTNPSSQLHNEVIIECNTIQNTIVIVIGEYVVSMNPVYIFWNTEGF
jgi:hypothetical protein